MMFSFGLTSKHHQSIAKHFAKWIFDSGVIGFLDDKFRVCLKPGIRSPEKIHAESLVSRVRKLSDNQVNGT